MAGSAGQPFTVNDSDPNLEYKPGKNSWGSFPTKANLTGKFPKVQGASVQLSFYGMDLSVTGFYFKKNDTLHYILDSNSSSITVPSTPSTFSISPALPCAPHIIELQPQQHFMFQSMQYTRCDTVSVLPQASASLVQSSSSTPAASATSNATAQDSAASSRSLRPTTIAGIVVGSVLFLVALVTLLFFLWRRRRRRQAHHPSAAYMASLERTASNEGLFNHGTTMYRSDTKDPLPATDDPGSSSWGDEKQPAALPPHGGYLPDSKVWPRRPDTAVTNRTSGALEDEIGSRRSVILPPYPVFEAI